VVQLASILAWGASGRPFESGHSDKRAAEVSAAFFVFLGLLRKKSEKKSYLKSIENQLYTNYLPKNTTNKLFF